MIPPRMERDEVMVDEFNSNGSGWARFSLDRRKRFRLGRSLDHHIKLGISDQHRLTGVSTPFGEPVVIELVRCVFLMINPSTADAFKPDRTIDKCVLFANRWGCNALEVVNLFAFRSTDPKGLDRAAKGHVFTTQKAILGSDFDANAEILAACRGAKHVIAAWGNNGTRFGRDIEVMQMMQRAGIQLLHLGETKELHPLHPLARGKSFIPLDREPRSFPVAEGE